MAELVDLIKQASNLACDLIISGGVITPEIDEALDIERDILAKTDFFGLALHAVMEQAHLANSRVVQWQAIELSANEGIKILKHRMKTLMEASHLKKVVGDQSTFELVPVPPAIIIEHPKQIPPEFVTTEYPESIKKIDMGKLLVSLTEDKGRVIPGCHLDKSTKLIHRVSLKTAES